jgi:hypothetical protein
MRQKFNCRAPTNMQINVVEYFEKGALLKCRDKVAIIEQSARYTFAEIERFAKNCAALILKQNAAVKRPVAGFLPKSEQMLAEQGLLRVSPLGDGSIRCVSERAARELHLELLRKSADDFIEEPFSAQRADKTFTTHNLVAL